MKTIEERARAHANENYPEMPLFGGWADDGWDEGYNAAGRGIAEKSFIVGAESQRTELTRWNDPKEVLPDQGTEVLVKYQDLRVFMACYENSEFGWHCYEPRNSRWYGLQDNMIVGWRNIDN